MTEVTKLPYELSARENGKLHPTVVERGEIGPMQTDQRACQTLKVLKGLAMTSKP